jgi:hypothetical protein
MIVEMPTEVSSKTSGHMGLARYRKRLQIPE